MSKQWDRETLVFKGKLIMTELYEKASLGSEPLPILGNGESILNRLQTEYWWIKGK